MSNGIIETTEAAAAVIVIEGNEVAEETTMVEEIVATEEVVETTEEKLARLTSELAGLGLVIARPTALPTAKKFIAHVGLSCPTKDCGTPILNAEGGVALDYNQAGPGLTFTCTTCNKQFTSPKSAFIY